MFLCPCDLYCKACFGIIFVSTLCTCCSHFNYGTSMHEFNQRYLLTFTRSNILHTCDGYKGCLAKLVVYKSLESITALFKNIFVRYLTAQWPYHSTRQLRIVTIMMYVRFLPPDCVTRVSDQDCQHSGCVIKISHHENSAVPTNIKVVGLVTIQK
jgi:hypothetical protein